MFISLVWLCATLCLSTSQAAIRNQNVQRFVDLTDAGSNLVVFNNDIAFQKDADDKFYYFAIAKDYEWSFVALNVLGHSRDGQQARKLVHHKVDSLPANFFQHANLTQLQDNLLLFRIELEDTSNTQRIVVQEFHKGRREPYPKVIRVYEQQKVELFDSRYFLSVYETEQSLYVLKVSERDVHYTSVEPSDTDSDKITYGPYKNLAPITFEQVQLMYTFPQPLPKFTEARRDIYVSHWGSVAVDEYFYILNEAAGINGQFSRVDYMPHINPSHGANAISSMASHLPQYIHGLYYYDYIGNISSSAADRRDDHVFFNIEPRFPIFGQWKTDWNQGYNMPTQFHLYQDMANPQLHTLEVDYMHAYDHSLTEDYTVRIILPEGAENIELELPGALENTIGSIEMGLFFGTLDYFGRPQITIRSPHAVHELSDDIIRVKYTFNNSRDLYLEPICVFGLILCLFLAAIIYDNLGLDLEKKSAVAEEKAKVQ